LEEKQDAEEVLSEAGSILSKAKAQEKKILETVHRKMG
jgi:hypothetical protein